jgi:hypothetical protein
VTEVSLQAGFAVQLSVAKTDKVTGTSLWFGGERTFGDGDTEEIVGGCVSTTVTLPVHEAESPPASVTVNWTEVVPNGYGPGGV